MAALAAAPQITAPAGALSDGDRSFLQNAINQPPRLAAGTTRFLSSEYSNADDWGQYVREELPSSPRGVREPVLQAQDTIPTMNSRIAQRWTAIQTELQANQELLTQNGRSGSFLKLYRASLLKLSDHAHVTQADYDRANMTARLVTLEAQASHLRQIVAAANRRLGPNSSSCIIL